MSRERIPGVLAPLRLLGLSDTACFESVPQFLKYLVENVVADIPNTVTNVTVSNVQPSDAQRNNLWFRLNNAGDYVGLYIFSSGAWTLILDPLPTWQSWEVPAEDWGLNTGGGASFFAIDTYTARYISENNGKKITFNVSGTGEVVAAGGASIRLPLPVTAANVSFGGGGVLEMSGAGIPQSAQVRIVTTDLLDIALFDWSTLPQENATFNVSGVYEAA